MAQKILIVEDEEKIARFVELELLHEDTRQRRHLTEEQGWTKL